MSASLAGRGGAAVETGGNGLTSTEAKVRKGERQDKRKLRFFRELSGGVFLFLGEESDFGRCDRNFCQPDRKNHRSDRFPRGIPVASAAQHGDGKWTVWEYCPVRSDSRNGEAGRHGSWVKSYVCLSPSRCVTESAVFPFLNSTMLPPARCVHVSLSISKASASPPANIPFPPL